MPTREHFECSKARYGSVASWAIWSPPYSRERINTADLTVFDGPGVLDRLQSKYVLLGANFSLDVKLAKLENFHGGAPRSPVWRLRHAVHNTCLSGSYLTDVIKDHVDPKAANVLARARKDPSWFETHIRLLKDELKCVGAENAILVAMGAVAHDLLMKAKKEHGLLNDVKKIRHYAWQRSDDAYYQTVRNEIESIGKSSSD